MYRGRRSAERDRMRRSGLARVAAQLAAPVALGLLIGGVLAYQAGSTNDAVHPVPLGAVPSPTPSFGKSSPAGKPSSTAAGPVAPPSPARLTPPASLTPATATASAVPTATPTATANASGR